MKTLLLIDANSIIHRSFHALPPLTGPAGEPSGAIYGIASILLKLLRDADRPDYAAALFDRPEPTFRDKMYAAYKAQRPPAASELVSQIIEAHNLFQAFGIKTFEKPGFEADDLIATFAEHFSAKGESASGGRKDDDLRVVILTGDRDTFQLVTGDKLVVRMFNTGISDTTVYDEGAVIQKYGLAPSQLVDYKALVGDSSDNVKGVPGVGPKTATELIKRFGTIENLYANIAGAQLEKRLGPFKKEAELSKKLVVLERHVPVEIPELAELAPPLDPTRIVSYLQRKAFATLLKRLEQGVKEEGRKTKVAEEKRQKGVQGRMF
jgi:DNA polymerase-1